MNETNKEKRAMVRVRLSQADAAELSDRAIARELNVSQPFVSGVRRSLSRASGDVLTPEGREDPASAAAVAGPAGPASDDQASAATLAPSTQGAPMYETSAAAMRRFLSDPVADTSDPDPTDPLAPPEGADAASNDAVEAPGIDAIAILADLSDEERVLKGRLTQLEEDKLDLIERVVRGTATRAQLTDLTREQLELKTSLMDVEGLRGRLAELARAQAEREKLRAYRATVDQVEASFVAAVQEAQHLEAVMQELVAGVERCHRALNWTALLYDVTSEPILNSLRTLAKEQYLRSLLADRLAAVGIVPVTDADPRAASRGREMDLQQWVQTWTSRFLAAARRDVPTATPQPEDAA